LSHHPDLFEELLGAFRGVDDLYVWERLFCAAFGACCLVRSPKQVSAYADLAARTLFFERTPPPNLLLRDFGYGIVELAEKMGVLPESVNSAHASPPYVSSRPALTLKRSEVEQIASDAGDEAILHSCRSFGDFGRYTIEHRVSDFTTQALSGPIPLTAAEKLKKFEHEVIASDPRRAAALKRVRDLRSLPIRILWMSKKGSRKPSKRALRKLAVDIAQAERNLLGLFDASERRRYRAEARPELGFARKVRRQEPRHVDPEAAKLWVAKRAYEFGWTKKRFQHEVDSHDFRGDSGRPKVERIGKKYQWLALSELLCRLADNYWIGGGPGEETRKYRYSTDIGFIRDVDPTVLPASAYRPSESLEWTAGPEIIIPSTAEDTLVKWPYLVDPGAILPALIKRIDPRKQAWTTLSDYRSVTTRYEGKRLGIHGLRQQEFRFVYAVLVDSCNVKTVVDYLNEKKKIDIHSWDPPEFTDGPYVLEAPWRDTWPQERWREEAWGAPAGVRISFPVFDYHWESHLDASLPRGSGAFLPAPWLAREMGISPDRSEVTSWVDHAGDSRFINAKSQPGGSVALIESTWFQSLLERQSLECIWVFLAERNAWPGGDNDNAAWRRSEGFCWIEGGQPRAVTWNEDRSRVGDQFYDHS
jgi:hypothetical protein